MSTAKFDLSTAIHMGIAVTRDGRAVSNLHYPNQTNDPYPIIGKLDGATQAWRLSGRFMDEDSDHPNDLVHPSVEIAPEQAEHPGMNQQEQTKRFADDLDMMVERYRREFDLTYASVVGVLQMKVHLMCDEAGQQEET